jgi:hypothetical protein
VTDGEHTSRFVDTDEPCRTWRKEEMRKDYAVRRQFNEKPSIVPSSRAELVVWTAVVTCQLSKRPQHDTVR